jgi:hypothetical protein
MLREWIFQCLELEILALPHPLSRDCLVGIGIESAFFERTAKFFSGKTIKFNVLTHFLSIHSNVQTLNLTLLSYTMNVECFDKTDHPLATSYLLI